MKKRISQSYNFVIFKKVSASILLTSFLSLHLALLPKITYAYYFDVETFGRNDFRAGVLDSSFYIHTKTETSQGLNSSNPINGELIINSNLSVDSLFTIKTSTSNEDEYDDLFCSKALLSLTSQETPSISFKMPLASFESKPIILASVSKWNTQISISKEDDIFEDAKCDFKLDLLSYQKQDDSNIFDGGFYDREHVSGQIVSTIEISSASFSPIKDSWISHVEPGSNNGSDNELIVRSHALDEARSIVSFNYKLPSNLKLKNAQLSLRVKNAPSALRTYQLNQINEAWTENVITWGNQPSFKEPSVAIANVDPESNDKLITWDVTDNVQELISLEKKNNGWLISDVFEQSSESFQTKFHSREARSTSKKPKLVLSFDVPHINTDHLVINEAYYDVASDKGSASNNEWVEIYNPTDSAIDISGWKICDTLGCDTIPESTTPIPSHGFAVISPDSSTWNTYWNLPTNAIRILITSSIGSGGLNNAGEALKLKKADDTVVDALSYGNDNSIFNPSIPDVSKGHSIARIIKGFDNDTPEDFIDNLKPNPGTNPSQTDETVETIAIFEDGFIMEAGEVDILPMIKTEMPLPTPAQANPEIIEKVASVTFDELATKASVSKETPKDTTAQDQDTDVELSEDSAAILSNTEAKIDDEEVDTEQKISNITE